MNKSILVVDDHTVIRKGLTVLLRDFYSGLRIYEAIDDISVLSILKQHPIDIIALDLQLPGVDTINLIEILSIKYPDTYILVFSMLSEALYGRRILKAGASGYLNKDAPVEEVKKAFDLALANKKYISQHMAEILAKNLSNKAPDNPFDKLSHREFEIIHLLLKGNTISAIGQKLNIKPSTVGTYKSRIFEKLHVSSLFELNQLAVLYGINQNNFIL